YPGEAHLQIAAREPHQDHRVPGGSADESIPARRRPGAEFRRAGLTVMIGGFHVSGYLALLPGIPADIQQLMDEGVTIVKGEVEETWGDLLSDAIHGRLKPLYDFIDNKPDLYEKPIPAIRKSYLKKFVAPNFGTLDCG